MQEINTKPLISVIVPVYNTGSYLERCVQSILNQDYPNIELLLVDDGSKDALTIQLCDKLAAENASVSTYHKPNGGSASARNYGIRKAKGKYVGFIDSDDVIEPFMYSTLYKDIVTYNVRVAIGTLSANNKENTTERNKTEPAKVYEYNTLMHHFLLGEFHSACTILYEKALFDDTLFPEGEVNEDYMLNYWIFKKLDKVSVNDTLLYHYIKRDGSNTGSGASLKFLDWFKHTELVLSEMNDNNKLVREAEYQFLYSCIILANKSLLTLRVNESADATSLYKISTDKLVKNRGIIKQNQYLKGRYRIMAYMMSYCPNLYKWSILLMLKLKNLQ